MIKLTEKEKRSYELEWLEATVQLAILEYENYKWLHQEPQGLWKGKPLPGGC